MQWNLAGYSFLFKSIRAIKFMVRTLIPSYSKRIGYYICFAILCEFLLVFSVARKSLRMILLMEMKGRMMMTVTILAS